MSLSVRRGTLTGLIGPNGAGKSTLLAMLAGTLPPTAGTISYLGQDITALPAFRRARVGLVRTFQLASEFKRLTVLENLLSAVPGNRGDSLAGAILRPPLLGRRRARRHRPGRGAAAPLRAARRGQPLRRRPQRRPAAAGRDHAGADGRADLLLLDEPMAGVHPDLARRIGRELVALCQEGMTMLMVEHELAIMDEFCDPVVVMAEGAVLAEGTMAELRAGSEVVEAYLVG